VIKRMEPPSKLVTAVIHGAALKADVSVVEAATAAAAATGNEGYWMGNSPEEKARVLSWLQADLANEKLLVGTWH
jgi:hypothetical protein